MPVSTRHGPVVAPAHNGRMSRLADLVAVSAQVAATPGRRAKTAAIATYLRALPAGDVALATAYLAGDTRQGRQGVGYAALRDAMPQAPAPAASLALADVDAALAALERTRGRGSAQARAGLLRALFERATAAEQDFLVRLLLGELRQGALEGLMIEAVAEAAGAPPDVVRRAAMVAGGIATVAADALAHGATGLRAHAVRLFQPLSPMLAQPAEDIAEALATLAQASVEWKLDGARVQAHKSGDEVRVYTRTGNDVTASVPEVVAAVQAMAPRALILDGEAIALHADGRPWPFQDTMRRFARTQDVGARQQAMPLSVFFFDCLRLDDDDLMGEPAANRFEVLSRVVPAAQRAPSVVTADAAAALAFYDAAVARGHEGVMVKDLASAYVPGARSAAWRKVKRTHTLDLVVLAAEWGHGRRHGRLSNLHLGARDTGGGFVMLGKTFKGLTDALLEWQTRELLAREVSRQGATVYVRPELVVEIAFNDLQASPRYPGALALRFARVKGYRPDKRPEEADTMDTVRAIYAAQRSGSEP
jgi:DNA ligase-1